MMQINQVYIVDSFSYQYNTTTCIIDKTMIWFKHNFKTFVTKLVEVPQVFLFTFDNLQNKYTLHGTLS